MLRDALMGTITFRRAAKRGVVSVFRDEGWGTSVGALFGVLLILQMLLLLAVGVQGGLELLRQRTDLRLQIRSTATDTQIQDLFQNVRQLPYVEDAVYVTREQAFERQKKRDPALIEFLTTFGIENPFPDTLGVRLRRLQDYQEFIQFLRQPVFAAVVDPAFLTTATDQQDQVERLTEVVSASRILLLFVTGLTVTVLLFITVEFIRRRALQKRQELFVQQLVGAGMPDILLPFMIELFCLLAAALFCSYLAGVVMILLLPRFLPALGSAGMFAPWSAASVSVLFSWLPWILFFESILIIFLSVAGTLITLRSQMTLAISPSR